MIAVRIDLGNAPVNATNGVLFWIAPRIEPANAPNGVLFWIAPRIEPANAPNGVLFWIGLGFAARTGLGECSLALVPRFALLH